MTKFLFGEENDTFEKESDVKLKYFVLEESKYFEDTNEEIKTYGISIEKISNNGSCEMNSICDVALEKEDVVSMISVLKKNKILPVHLKDVIEDMM